MTEQFASWAILELMGHRRLAGYVTEAEVAGGKFIRIDVPGKDGHGPRSTVATQFYAASSVYCLTPTTEEIARKVAESAQVMPAVEWDLRRALAAAPAERVPAGPVDDDFDDDFDEDDDDPDDIGDYRP